MKCKTCGIKIEKNTEICPSCGASSNNIDSEQKPKKKKLKTFVIVIISIVATVFLAVAIIFTIFLVEVIQEDNATMAMIEANPDLEYYEQIEDYISYDSYNTLYDIFDIYGIIIRFEKDSITSSSNKYISLPKSSYDNAITYIYSSLEAFGYDDSTIEVFDNTIDFINCYDKIIEDGYEYITMSNSYSKSVALAFNNQFNSDTKYKMETFSSVIAWTIADKFDQYNSSFGSYNANGFVAYDYDLENSDHEYINILESLDIDDYEQQMLKAGFLYNNSTIYLEKDFVDYFTSLFSNDYDFWEIYSQYESIYNKTNEVIKIAQSVNPIWTLEYFLELGHPEGIKALSSIKNLKFDNTDDYIGEWTGTYQNNSGEMNLEIEIYEFNEATEELNAIFSFSSGKNNNDGKSGAYYMKGNVNLKTGEILLYADKWISEKPKGYEMLHLKGRLIGDRFVGELDREEMREFLLTKKITEPA